MKKYKIRRILHDGQENTELFRHVTGALDGVPVEKIGSGDSEDISRSVNKAKEELFLTRSPASVLKPCPGTDDSYICCNYWVLNQASQCPIDCSYCILQFYLTDPGLTMYTNIEDMKKDIRRRTAQEKDRFMRIGTGELTDSLALDPVSGVSAGLIEFAAEEKKFLLELKTKSDNIDHLLELPHEGYTVLAWSLNPPYIIRTEEHKSASLEERLGAAAKAEKAGYKLAFHFDPMIHYDAWEDDYRELVKTLFEYVRPESIVWISMGSLRYPPEMKDRARAKFPFSPIYLGEMVMGKDNKMRYYKGIRLKMYAAMVRWLREFGSPDLFLYFCMEDREVWRTALGRAPENDRELDFLFAESIAQRFPDLKVPNPDINKYQLFTTPRRGNVD